MKRALSTLARIAVSAVLLGLLLYLFRDRLDEVARTIRTARAGWLALAAAWYVAFIVISAWRWKVLLAARGLRFSIWYLSRVFVLSLFFCKLLPTSIGGDVLRIAYTSRGGDTASSLSATFLDRLIGFVSLMFLAVAVSLALFGTSAQARELELPVAGVTFRGLGIVALLVAGLALLVLLTLALFSDAGHRLAMRVFGRVRLLRFGERLDRVYGAVKSFRHAPRALFVSFLSGIGVQAALALSWHAVGSSIGGTVALPYYLVFIPLLNIVVNIPTIGGIGVREWAFVLLFTPAWLAGRFSQETALAAALLFLALDMLFALTGGVLFALMRRSTGGPAAGSRANGAGKRDCPLVPEDSGENAG